MPENIALLTDSTWSMPAQMAVEQRIKVLPLHVTAGAVSVADSPENEARMRELLAGTKPPSTSQPSAAEIRQAFEELAAGGADRILATHLSGALSGTCDGVRAVGEAFREETGIAVDVVDTRSIGAAIGFAVLAARHALDAGGTAEEAIAEARRVAHGSNTLIMVPDLSHLSRGGRLSASSALIGTALGVRPLIRIQDGALVPAESVRGEARARRRMVEIVISDAQARAATGSPLDFAVHHTGKGAAGRLVDDLRRAAADAGLPIGRFLAGRISPVLAAHSGPDALAIVSAPSFEA